MPTYNVHVYREMKLYHHGIEADSLEHAAALARDLPTRDAQSCEDCEGRTFAALVDVQGDEEHVQSRMIDFEPEAISDWDTVGPDLLAALEEAIHYIPPARIDNARAALSKAEHLA